MKIKPFSTTGIGSLPHTEAREAVRLVLDTFDIPFWPQLPKLSFREGMVAQYAEGMPFLRTDDSKGAVWVERNNGEELERFYESYKDTTLIAISEEHAKGIYAFLYEIKGRRFPILKGHVTGPLTFALGLNDGSGRAIYYDEELREIALMLLKAKVRWQVEALRPHADGIIIFVDEPIVSALGSSGYMGVQRDEALRLLRELCNTVSAAGAVPGIHCCGRAEWPLLLEAGITILNFDSYGFAETLGIYPDEVKKFIQSGGYLAWGAVPTTEAVAAETPDSIKSRFARALDGLSRSVPRELLLEKIILTPSCGAGSLDIPGALKAFQLLMRLKEDFA